MAFSSGEVLNAADLNDLNIDTLTTTGNVGIGTTTPETSLHIVTTNKLGSTFTGTIDGEGLRVDQSNYVSGNYVSLAEASSDDGTATPNVRVGAQFTGSGSKLVFGTSNSYASGITNEAMTIDQSGNVGIGTGSPAADLEIDTGSISSTSGTTLEAQRWQTEAGVNDTFMEMKAVRLATGTDWTTVGWRLQHQVDSVPMAFVQFNDDATGVDRGIQFGTNNAVRMTINKSGAVGINTTTPSATLDVNGSLSKGSGSFKIPHPLPEMTETHHLVHSFVEAPQADNLYRGRVALVEGAATVDLDEAAGMTTGTFELLNRDLQCFTVNNEGWTAVRGVVSGSTLTIEAQDASCADTVDWLVIGERHDQHMYDTEWTDDDGRVIVEPEKPQVTEDTET